MSLTDELISCAAAMARVQMEANGIRMLDRNDAQVDNDPTLADDSNDHLCDCGALMNPCSDRCPTCQAEYDEALEDALRDEEMMARQSDLEDLMHAETRESP